MTLKKHDSLLIIIIKQFCVSVLLGCFPTLILFFIVPTKADFIIQWYFIIGCFVFFMLSLVLKFIWLPHSRVIATIRFARDVFKETASGLKNIIQTIVGAIFAVCLIWSQVEPQSLSFSRLGLLLIIGLIFMFFSAYLEMGERHIER
jgi:Na+/melibiose symporter-like transporter